MYSIPLNYMVWYTQVHDEVSISMLFKVSIGLFDSTVHGEFNAMSYTIPQFRLKF